MDMLHRFCKKNNVENQSIVLLFISLTQKISEVLFQTLGYYVYIILAKNGF